MDAQFLIRIRITPISVSDYALPQYIGWAARVNKIRNAAHLQSRKFQGRRGCRRAEVPAKQGSAGASPSQVRLPQRLDRFPAPEASGLVKRRCGWYLKRLQFMRRCMFFEITCLFLKITVQL
jgi:hypothetical protein